MTPGEIIRGVKENSRRRWQEQPAITLLMGLKWAVEIGAGLLLIWTLAKAGHILVEWTPQKELVAKHTDALVKVSAALGEHETKIEVQRQKMDDAIERLKYLERHQ